MKLIAQSLDCERGGRIVFRGLTFDVAAGEAMVVVGPNGIGKSSLLRLIAGLIEPVAGSLTLSGGDEDRSVGAQCHYFGHRDAVKPALSVRENIEFWKRFMDSPSHSVETALRAVGLDRIDHLPAAYLSAGQKRRLSLARLLVSRRQVWLMDEPTSALDAAAEQMLYAILNDHLANDGLVVAATHAPLDITPCRTLDLAEIAP
jgi:heme exporter protein A